MARCSFCGEDIEKGTGVLFVEKLGKVKNFCSSKCENNNALGRKPKYTRWTHEFRKARGKLSAEAERAALQSEAEGTAAGGKQKTALSGAAAKKLKGGA